MVATPAQGKALMDHFVKSCPNAPKFNRAVAKWAARELIESYDLDTCKRAVLWYAKVSPRPDWNNFVRVADDCVTEMSLHDKDVVNRRKFRAIANEWRNS